MAKLFELWTISRHNQRVLRRCAFLAVFTPSIATAGVVLSSRTDVQLASLPVWQTWNRMDELPRQRLSHRLAFVTWKQRSRGRGLWTYRQALRIEHDFGAFTTGLSRYDGRATSAIDVIPELAPASFGIDLFYATLRGEGLWNDRLDLELGRIVRFDEFEPWSFDGAAATLRFAEAVDVSVASGLAVRSSSIWGFDQARLDGTGLAECQEYVENAVAGEGTWQVIDRARQIDRLRSRSDLFVCPQHEAAMPTFEVGVRATWGTFAHRLRYRGAWSRSAGIIDDPRRFDFLDVGYYPNENGQAPIWGQDVSQLSWTSEGRVKVGKATLRPYGFARYAALFRHIDRVELGMESALRALKVGGSVGYRRPSFDADSIFAVFASGGLVQSSLWAESDAHWLRAWRLETTAEHDASHGLEIGSRFNLGRTTSSLTAGADGGLGGKRLLVSGGVARSFGSLLRATAEASVWRLLGGDTGNDIRPIWLYTTRVAGQWDFLDTARIRFELDATSDAVVRRSLRGLVTFEVQLEPEF